MTNVVICCLVATSPTAMWHLIPMFKNELGGGDVSAHLGIGHRGRCCISHSCHVGNNNVAPSSHVNRGGGGE